jgi:hypothetical protein
MNNEVFDFASVKPRENRWVANRLCTMLWGLFQTIEGFLELAEVVRQSRISED